jgi:hypothetical protein
MKFYNLAFYYSAFNTGYGLTSPIKWVAATFGIGSAIQGYNLLWILFGSVIYFLLCIAVGSLCYKHGWVDAINEVNNRYNPLAKELRGKLKIKRFK